MLIINQCVGSARRRATPCSLPFSCFRMYPHKGTTISSPIRRSLLADASHTLNSKASTRTCRVTTITDTARPPPPLCLLESLEFHLLLHKPSLNPAPKLCITFLVTFISVTDSRTIEHFCESCFHGVGELKKVCFEFVLRVGW